MDWHALAKKKVTDLREMAHEQGHTSTSGLSKEQLVEWLADKLEIDKPHKVVDARAKAKIKAEIKELKLARQQALEAGDKTELKKARRQIHRLKRRMRRSAHLTH